MPFFILRAVQRRIIFKLLNKNIRPTSSQQFMMRSNKVQFFDVRIQQDALIINILAEQRGIIFKLCTQRYLSLGL
jgi:hypothetical protein